MISLDIFPQVLERTSILYFPFISDEKKIEDCDIALVEGCVSKESQISLLKTIRKKAKKLYAFGSCSAFGGILSLSRKKNAEPISEYVEIDGIIPGCPPPAKLLGNYLIKMIENKPLKLSDKNLCYSCPLRESLDTINDIQITKLFPDHDEIKINEANGKAECFLKKGILCLGPITREGCDQKCIEFGIPCEGCMGPVSKEYFSNVINFLSLLDLSKNLKKYKGIFYRFSKPKIRK